MTAPTLPIIPYNHTFLLVELSALLAAAPEELRLLNLHDRRADEGSQVLDDGLADFDASDFVDELEAFEAGCDELGEEFGP